ncbi:hypothetical protein [Spongorhabdus nitratireducens]
MADDLAFRIQLGLVMPKLKQHIAPELSKIVEELVKNARDGSADEGVDMAPVKELIMKDLDIFLDNEILPPLEQKYNPKPDEAETPEEEAPAEEAAAES